VLHPCITPSYQGMAEVKITRIVYKGALLEDLKTCCVIALGIPEDACIVTREDDEKERSNKAFTLGISSIMPIDCYSAIKRTDPLIMTHWWYKSAMSMFYNMHGEYHYNVRQLQIPTQEFDSDTDVICTSGIHFFGTIQSAVKYVVTSGGIRAGCCDKLTVEGTERFVKFAEEQVNRYNKGQPLMCWPKERDEESTRRWKGSACSNAARFGQLKVLQQALADGCPWNENTCSNAAKGGHLEVLQWARANGCLWNEVTCSEAAFVGRLDVLQWARTNGCPWDEDTCSCAARGGHLELLQWARANGCPWDKSTCECAARGGHLNVLKWARANGCPLDESACVAAKKGGHWDTLHWLVNQFVF